MSDKVDQEKKKQTKIITDTYFTQRNVSSRNDYTHYQLLILTDKVGQKI